jgi:hypothetical protein
VGVDALVCVNVDDFSVQLPPESDETYIPFAFGFRKTLPLSSTSFEPSALTAMSLAEMTVLGMVNCVTVGSAAFALFIVVGIATINEPITLEINILYIDDDVIVNRSLRMLLASDINRVIILKNTRVGL